MLIRGLILLFTTALASAGAVVSAASPRPEFVAAWRAGDEAALLDSTGHIHVYGSKGAVGTVALTAAGRLLAWKHVPTALARLNNAWIVADGTRQLKRFAANGALITSDTVPSNVSDLAVAGKTLWAANYLSPSASRRLWSSADGRRFVSVPMKDDVTDPFALLFRSQMILAGSPSGELFVAHLIDGPVVHRVFPPSSAASWPVAYMRSRSRANLVQAEEGIDDLTLYSSPVRDMITRSSELIVLRNREDMRTAQGVVTQQGIRADRYGPGGRHLASAVFSEPMKWILRSDSRQVTAVTINGVVRVARWSKPLGGSIIR